MAADSKIEKLLNSPEYLAYRQRVIDACVKRMGEDTRTFWETQCSWEEDFAEQLDPAEVAENQFDALT
jgi:hypothetical protein